MVSASESMPEILTADATARRRAIRSAARPAGIHAELLPARTQRFAGRVGQLGEERAAADPRRIRLRDAQHVAELRRTEPVPAAAAEATVPDDVTNGYVPQSISSITA